MPSYIQSNPFNLLSADNGCEDDGGGGNNDVRGVNKKRALPRRADGTEDQHVNGAENNGEHRNNQAPSPPTSPSQQRGAAGANTDHEMEEGATITQNSHYI